jgi:hypothetical protein
MFKKEQIKMFIGGLLLTFAVINSACSSGTATAQTPRVKPAESSPTPEYKPPKRVSRDIIKTETKAEAITKAKPVKAKAK